MPALCVGISLLVRRCLAIPLNRQERPRFLCAYPETAANV
nr:MAG TPA: hypothetical protein [Caudoviricetes sp.]DAH01161.1 MAG TPA: hypothetical protein [Crassvirales sp.]DAI58815.1 MAG TPA: hypothetical protein [Crassvirales sp.]DAM26497.1 MAG TPA: hypothetical protein [Caudoviricetes sp.]